jgi:hypothetical protein
MLVSLVVMIFIQLLNQVKSNSHFFKETAAGLSLRSDLVKENRVSPDVMHKVVFAIKQKNIDELTRILEDVSDPSSLNYGKHKTRQEITDLTSNPTSRTEVLAFLTLSGATYLSETVSGEYITASAPIKV